MGVLPSLATGSYKNKAALVSKVIYEKAKGTGTLLLREIKVGWEVM